jgi:glycosyltransferase involved in cell wall biosynthesis
MHLLVLTSNPDNASFRYRVGAYLDLLRRRGIDAEVVRLPGSILARRALFASARGADGVLLQRKLLTAWDGFWLRRYARRVIYDFDDAIMYADRKGGRNSRLRFRRFGRSVALSHVVIAGNEYLAAHARRYNANVCILPTGLDVGRYRLPGRDPSDGLVRLVWIGGRSTLRHLREIGPALDQLARRFPNVVLRIICNDFVDLAVMKVEKQPWSEQTEAADLAASDIGLAPLPDNPFTRGKCGFKILQYQAAGLPVVASPVGVNAQYVRDGVTGFLTQDAAQWVDRLRALIEDPELRAALGRAGRREVERFDVRVIGASLGKLVEDCLRQR